MIISGGVNFFPQDVVNVLSARPAVVDCAVFGVCDADLGEKLVAVIQTWDPRDAGEALARELGAWCRERISAVDFSEMIVFESQLPREPNGKLHKQALQQRYSEVAGGPSAQAQGSTAAT